MGGNAGGMGMMPGSGMAQMGGGGSHGMLHTAFLPQKFTLVPLGPWMSICYIRVALSPNRISAGYFEKKQLLASCRITKNRKQRSIENIA
jgi:hypothetical protein